MLKIANPPGMISDKICVVVANYDFSDNADWLAESFGYFFHSVLIDASSPSPPKTQHISIPNTLYPGLWNAAVGYALENNFEWLMFVASDLQIDEVELLCRSADEAINYEQVGIYTPSVSPSSRCSFKNVFNRTSAVIRECGVCEGFFFLGRTSILKSLYPLDVAWTYGWGVDVASAFEAYRQKKIVAVDDRVMIYHPARKSEHDIDDTVALAEYHNFLTPEHMTWIDETIAESKFKNINLNITTSLDLGCGPNPQNNFGSQHLYGIDIRDIDNHNVRKADLNIEPIPFEDNAFDYVTANDFIEHVARMLYAPHLRFPFIELMNEIHRVLKPGGVFLSVTPAYPDVKAFQDPTHVNFITEKTFNDYFCTPNLLASMYGFSGRFLMLHQAWNDGKLVTYMRASKS